MIYENIGFNNTNYVSVNTLIQSKKRNNIDTLDLSSKSFQKSENKTGLPDNLKNGLENLSGMSMDDVKVHYNSPKPAQLQSLAYTQGVDIHLAPGQEQHLPHEAWHVVQQKQGRVHPAFQIMGIGVNNDAGLEQEADVMRKSVLMNKPAKGAVKQFTTVSKENEHFEKNLDAKMSAVQRRVISEAAELTETEQLFQKLGRSPKDEWEIAAAKSILADYVIYNLTDGKGRIENNMKERIHLVHAIISIANTGILSGEERARRNIQSQQSVDPQTQGQNDKISLSQAEIGEDQTSQSVAELLEHQAMSVRMERYVEDGGRQVPEPFLDPKRFTEKEILEACALMKEEYPDPFANLKAEEVYSLCNQSRIWQKILYSTLIMGVRGKDPRLHHMLAQRASLAAMFIGTPDFLKKIDSKVWETMGLNQKKAGSHELRTGQSISAAALEYVLVPRHMQAFGELIRKYLNNRNLVIRYVDGFHQVKVSFQGMTGLPQVSFDIEAPNWANALKEILETEERIFAHVTRPLAQPTQLVNQEFMKSKMTKPLSLMDQLLANKIFGPKKASELFRVI